MTMFISTRGRDLCRLARDESDVVPKRCLRTHLSMYLRCGVMKCKRLLLHRPNIPNLCNLRRLRCLHLWFPGELVRCDHLQHAKGAAPHEARSVCKRSLDTCQPREHLSTIQGLNWRQATKQGLVRKEHGPFHRIRPRPNQHDRTLTSLRKHAEHISVHIPMSH